MSPDSSDLIAQLVAKFAAGVYHYTDTKGRYQEADARSEFIDPLLRALGWDVENHRALIPSKREVIREESLPQEVGASKRPDYTLRVDGIGKLYVEAKKPSVNILTDIEAIRQIRAYGWTKQHPIAVLTNFRNVRIFNTSVPIGPGDTSTTALIFECEYQDLGKNLDRLADLIGRQAVREPTWVTQFGAALASAPLAADKRFVEQFNGWRVQLGQDLVANNTTMTEDEVNDAVQRILNRLVFVRMCEDRGIEGEGVLREAFKGLPLTWSTSSSGSTTATTPASSAPRTRRATQRSWLTPRRSKRSSRTSTRRTRHFRSPCSTPTSSDSSTNRHSPSI